MSKINIPTCTLSDPECNTLFESVVEKLNIQNPRFHYPIYNKIVDNASDSRGLIFDSKFKVCEILSKVVDSDSDDYEIDEDETNGIDAYGILEKEDSSYTFNLEDSKQQESTTENQDLQEDNTLDEVLNIDQDVELVKAPNPEILDSISDSRNDDDDDDDDKQIDEAINNVFTANAMIERVNKTTGEKTIKQEQIHIKKSPLLEPLKVLKDEFLIPARLKNQYLTDETLQRTRAKLDSYNNSAHVEALFLYLGNKLVESGKCPSFPYYYGCINGEDPNYHHDITDEYDMVSRTKWFRQRVKTDFDLLILEGDEMDEAEKEMVNRMHRPHSHQRFQNDGCSPDSENDENYNEDTDSNSQSNNEEDNDFKAYKKYLGKNLETNHTNKEEEDDYEDEDENEDDIEKTLDFLDKHGGGSGGSGGS